MPDFISESSSYKDPDSRVFYYGDQVFRYIEPGHYPFYAGLLRNPLILQLMAAGELVGTEEAELEENCPAVKIYGTRRFFRHERIVNISYPYEWPFSMFRDAALFTLKLQKRLIGQDLSLKDATPFNIQYRGTKPVFIDYGSFEPISDNGVWFALNQFMQMFFYPLALKTFHGIDVKSLLLTQPEGISFAETYRLLGWKAKLRWELLPHFLLPRLFAVGSRKGKRKDTAAAKVKLNPRNNQSVQTFMVNRMVKLISKLKGYKNVSDWSDYTESKSYSAEADAFKKALTADFFNNHRGLSVLDLGANTGEFSLLAAQAGCAVTAVEYDQESIERLYLSAKEGNFNILPLWVDIANPTPGIGWNNRERSSFVERYQADCVLALALAHHLLITRRQPLEQIAELFADLTKKFLLVEYIGRADAMFQELILNRRESYGYFNLDYFKEIFQRSFRIVREEKVPQMDRVVFVMEKLC